MSSTEETIAKVASFYAAQADWYNITYEQSHAEAKYRRLRQRYHVLFAGRDVLAVPATGPRRWRPLRTA
jgi:hypothetical protein